MVVLALFLHPASGSWLRTITIICPPGLHSWRFAPFSSFLYWWSPRAARVGTAACRRPRRFVRPLMLRIGLHRLHRMRRCPMARAGVRSAIREPVRRCDSFAPCPGSVTTWCLSESMARALENCCESIVAPGASWGSSLVEWRCGRTPTGTCHFASSAPLRNSSMGMDPNGCAADIMNTRVVLCPGPEKTSPS